MEQKGKVSQGAVPRNVSLRDKETGVFILKLPFLHWLGIAPGKLIYLYLVQTNHAEARNQDPFLLSDFDNLLKLETKSWQLKAGKKELSF